MVRLLHHAHTQTRPDPASYPAGPCVKNTRPLYMPPGPPTIITPFIVLESFVKEAESSLSDSTLAPIWQMVADMCKLQGLGGLQVKEKGMAAGAKGEPQRTHQVLAPRLHLMVAGAPVVAAIISEVPAVLETKVGRLHVTASQYRSRIIVCDTALCFLQILPEIADFAVACHQVTGTAYQYSQSRPPTAQNAPSVCSKPLLRVG